MSALHFDFDAEAARIRHVLYDYGIDDATVPGAETNLVIDLIAALPSSVVFPAAKGHEADVAIDDDVDDTNVASAATADVVLSTLRARLTRASATLLQQREESWEPAERQRLHGKAEGVRLAASYVDDEARLLTETEADL